MGFYIKSFVHLQSNRLSVENEFIYEAPIETPLKDFIHDCYREMDLKYPKFHKMDLLCKAGILAMETIHRRHNLSETDTALVLSNRSSSLYADEKFMNELETEKFASPALFVYTLPNIILGEASIKYRLKSENAFFIEPEFRAENLFDYNQLILEEKKAGQILSGWIEVDNENAHIFLYLAGKEGEIPYTIENIDKLYHKK